MRNLFCRCELNAVQAIAGAAIVTVALFAWANGSAMFDQHDVDNVTNPLWQVWQIGALVIVFASVWPLWFGTRRVSWVRSLALGVFAVTIFVNTYTGVFGDYSGEVWATVNPLFLAFCSVSAPALWRCGCPAGRVGAGIVVILGIVVFFNAYFINDGVVWRIMDPLMTMAALAWAAGASRANPAEPVD